MGLFLLQVFLTALHFVLEFTILFNEPVKLVKFIFFGIVLLIEENSTNKSQKIMLKIAAFFSLVLNQLYVFNINYSSCMHMW